MELCYKLNPEEKEDGSVVMEPDEDNFYGIINNDYQKIYLCQFFHFDRQIQPLSYFTQARLQK